MNLKGLGDMVFAKLAALVATRARGAEAPDAAAVDAGEQSVRAALTELEEARAENDVAQRRCSRTPAPPEPVADRPVC